MTHDIILARVLDDIADRVGTMETHSGTWGSAEALELQWLLLVEMRQRILRPRALELNPRETRSAWIKFIASVNGRPTSYCMSDMLREEGMLAELPRLLGDAARWIAQEYPPEWTP